MGKKSKKKTSNDKAPNTENKKEADKIGNNKNNTQKSKKENTKNDSIKNKLSDPKKILIIIAAVLGFLVICCIATALIIMIFAANEKEPVSVDGTPNLPTINQDNNYDHTTYLGYSDLQVEVLDNVSFSSELDMVHYGFSEMEIAEGKMIDAAEINDADAFFEAYRDYNLNATDTMNSIQAMSVYMDGASSDSDAFGSLFIQKAYAKERSSWWYYVPIIGSLVKAKHQSIETARAGVYDYMKNELAPVDQQTFLDEYGLDSIEDIRNASDQQVETLARDPELRTGIDWTKVATDVGKQAVIATVDGYKIGASRTPIKTTGIASAFRIASEKGGDVPDQMVDDEKRTTLITSRDTVNSLSKTVGENEGKKWSDISDADKKEIVDAVKAEIDSMGEMDVVTQGDEKDGGPKVNVAPGTYDLLTATSYTVPIFLTDVEVDEGQTTEILTVNAGFDVYPVDPEIAITLGFDAYVIQEELEISSCLDVVGSAGSDSSEYYACENSYETCAASPYEFTDEYYSCISSPGCWDIGRWEYVNENNCEIDAQNNLNYSNNYFAEDFEYFPDGNLAYCECVVDCRVQHSVERDCAGELRSCCENAN